MRSVSLGLLVGARALQEQCAGEGAHPAGPTPSNPEGPFWQGILPPDNTFHDWCLPVFNLDDENLTIQDSLFVNGTLQDADTCAPIENAEIHLWQCDDVGIYDDHTNLADHNCRTIIYSESSGQYKYFTFIPAYYAVRPRPQHVHIKIFHPDYVALVTQMYFAGDPLLGGEPLQLRATVSDDFSFGAPPMGLDPGDGESFQFGENVRAWVQFDMQMVMTAEAKLRTSSATTTSTFSTSSPSTTSSTVTEAATTTAATIMAPTPAPCADNDIRIVAMASNVGITIGGCDDVRSFCEDGTYGSTVQATCPETCGLCCADDDAHMIVLASNAGFMIGGCGDVKSFCDHGTYGRTVKVTCPVTCDSCTRWLADGKRIDELTGMASLMPAPAALIRPKTDEFSNPDTSLFYP